MVVKKLFVLVSVTALTGLMTATVGAGCSSSTDAPAATTDSAVPAVDGAPAPPKDSGPPDDSATPAASCPTTTPITAADIDAQIKWMPPQATQSVCVQKNIDDLKALFTAGGGKAKFTDIKDSLGAMCAACAFTKSTATNWGPLVEDGMSFLRNEVGSCFAQLDTPACGKAVFQADTCLNVVCPLADCTTAAAVTACKTKARTGACKALNAAVTPACPKLTTDSASCRGILDAIVVSCGGGLDGGLDAAP